MPSEPMPESLRALLAGARLKHIPKGQVILYEGDRPAEAFIIRNGVVKLHSLDGQEGQDKEKILHLLNANAVMPMAFFSRPDTPIRWHYTALTDCDIYVLPRNELLQFMQTDGRATLYLIHTFSEDVHEVLTRLESLGKSDTYDKLTAALTYLLVCHAEASKRPWRRVPFPVSHQLLANMMGVSRESTSIAMKTLTDKKIVRMPRLTQLEIHEANLRAYREHKPENTL